MLHVDRHLRLVAALRAWVYALLFWIVFVETGLVVMPFLPGDSLLFVVGALAGRGLSLSAGLCRDAGGGDAGRPVQLWHRALFRAEGVPVGGLALFNRRAFDKAHAFYERHGGVTVILARFMPFIRTFVPFVAGVAEMNCGKFSLFNVVGALIWVLGLVTAGHLFGNLPLGADPPEQDHLGADPGAGPDRAVLAPGRPAAPRPAPEIR